MSGSGKLQPERKATVSSRPVFRTRVEIIAEKGTEELLPPAVYEMSKGVWTEERGDHVLLVCYPEDGDAFLRLLADLRLPVRRVSVEQEEEKNYVSLTKKFFPVLSLPGVTITPPWRKSRRKGPRIVIEPGMAFGTGRHESTQIMIRLMKRARIAGRTVLDIGTGSGILSIYAHLLGAAAVAAVDNDPLAVEAATRNFAINHVADAALACASLDAICGKFEVVLANLDFQTFERFGPHVMRLVSSGGELLVSGIEGQFKEPFLSLFRPLQPARSITKHDWSGFAFTID